MEETQEEHITLDKVITEEIKEDVKSDTGESSEPEAKVSDTAETEQSVDATATSEVEGTFAEPEPKEEEKPAEEKPKEEAPPEEDKKGKKGEISIQWDDVSYVVITRDSIYIVEKGATEDESVVELSKVKAVNITETLQNLNEKVEKLEGKFSAVSEEKSVVVKKSKDAKNFSVNGKRFAELICKR